MAGYLIPEDYTDILLPVLLELLKDDTSDERRILGLELLDILAPVLGQEICQNYLIFELVSLQDDPVYRVRKETCKRLMGVSQVVDIEVF